MQWRRRLGAGLAVLLVVLTRSGTGAGGMIVTFLVFGLAGYYGKRSARKGSAMVTVVALVSAVSAAIAAVFLPSILGLYGKDLTFSNRTQHLGGGDPGDRPAALAATASAVCG